METTIDYLIAIQERMKAEELPDLAIDAFSYYYRQLVDGETGLISEESIVPVESLPDLEQLDERYAESGQSVIDQTVMLKLNGGLGTSMGLQRAKSLLTVKEGMTFLDIIAKQAIHFGIPLVLMNSFSTAHDSLAHLDQFHDLDQQVPLDFLQHKVPKISQEDFSIIKWEKEPKLEWCPPGHGDIYTALLTTGMLERLLENGIKYVFVSNSDNLGARLDVSLLGYFKENELPFMMEVADRTAADRKGGHLALDREGGFLLRESAQCPEDDMDTFQDINKHRYFNTNNLWIQLEKLKRVLDQNSGVLGLPMIRNRKTVDPRDASSPAVYQLETAMGAAIQVFEQAGAIRVPRSRFAPVKSTNQLLAVQSDAYTLDNDFSVLLSEERAGAPLLVNLDSRYYKTIDQMQQRFPYGAPSLVGASSLSVEGDVIFGKDVVCNGDATIVNQSENAIRIPDGEVITGDMVFNP